MSGARPGAYVGVDVGGTFTDVVLADADGRLVSGKVATTPDDPRRGVIEAIELVLDRAGATAEAVTRVVHGTTLATNVVLERRGDPVTLLTTEGFADLVRLGREVRAEDERFDLWFTTPEPPVRRQDTFEVRERVSAAGEVVVPLDRDHLADVVAEVARRAPAAVAVCLLNAYADPAHEQEVVAALRDALPADAYVIASSEVWPEMREYERAMTTVVCAYVGPVMAGYLTGLERSLAELGIGCPVEIMESSGGVMSAALAARRPVATLESGGAAGVIAAGFVGARAGAAEVVSFDMGGTTAKAGLVRDGRPDITHDFRVGGHTSVGGTGAGFPVRIPVVDLAEVGAGGGSIAWIDNGGALRVGPRSAGSVPGPACYGRGGTEPTVTDANLVLGFLREGPLNGGVVLDAARSRDALERAVAGPLGLGVVDAAHAVHEVANASMAAAIRVVTVQRGIDPRGFTMVGFGGAGPLHAARLADTFGIDTVIVPWAAGVASAVGLVGADAVVDRVLTEVLDPDEIGPDRLGDVFDRLERRARADLPGGDGDVEVSRSVDARFVGQAHQLNVPVPSGPLGHEEVDLVVKGFLDAYRTTYGIDLDRPVQLVTFHVRVLRRVPKPEAAAPGAVTASVAAPDGERPAHVAGRGLVPTPVHGWTTMPEGAAVEGPAVVEGPDTTVVVPPGFTASVAAGRDLVLTRSPAAAPTEPGG